MIAHFSLVLLLGHSAICSCFLSPRCTGSLGKFEINTISKTRHPTESISVYIKPSFVVLSGKKKDASPGGSDKVQVKLLKDVKDQGKKGAIIEVSKSFWINYLQKNRLAQVVSDKTVQAINEKKAEDQKQEQEALEDMRKHINSMECVKIERKANEETGRLFGKLGKKQVLELLKGQFPQDALNFKSVAIVEVYACTDDGECKLDLEKGQVDETGVYKAEVKLSTKPKPVTATFNFEVVAA